MEIPEVVIDTSVLVGLIDNQDTWHDARIASGCRDLGFKWIATFDSDFDQIAWLNRLYNPEGVREAFQKHNGN